MNQIPDLDHFARFVQLTLGLEKFPQPPHDEVHAFCRFIHIIIQCCQQPERGSHTKKPAVVACFTFDPWSKEEPKEGRVFLCLPG